MAMSRSRPVQTEKPKEPASAVSVVKGEGEADQPMNRIESYMRNPLSLSREDREALVDAILNPTPASTDLLAAASRYEKLAVKQR